MNKKYILAAINVSFLIILCILFIIGILFIKLYGSWITFLIISLLLISVAFILFAYFSTVNGLYNMGVFLAFFVNIVLIYNIVELNVNYNYFENFFFRNYDYVSYNVYVQKKNTTYSELSKLEGKKIGMLSGNNDNICSYLNDFVDIECNVYETTTEIAYAIENGEIQSFILTSEEYESINEEETDIKSRVRIIYTNKIKNAV